MKRTLLARYPCMRFVAVVLLATSLGACVDDPLLPGRRPMVTAHNLPLLSNGAYYELWVSTPTVGTNQKNPIPDHASGNYFSIGRFRPSKDSSVQFLESVTGTGAATFEIPSTVDPSLIADAILTVEDGIGVDTVPGPRFLSGDFVGTNTYGVDTLKLISRDAFGVSFYFDAGTFVLASPTSNNPDDNSRGIWFVDLKRDGSGGTIIDTLAGLEIPSQPLSRFNPGWAYQAWLLRYDSTAVVERIPLGRFYSPSGTDADGAGPGAGPGGGTYSAPGSDFVAPGLERTLNNGSYGVVISLEPSALNLGAPFMVLLERSRISLGSPTLESTYLEANRHLPQIEIYLDR